MTKGHDQGHRNPALPMLSVEEAQKRVLKSFEPLEAERVPILEAAGRILAEDIHADTDIPPHANSSMDGYAVKAADTAGASRHDPVALEVIGDLPAGYVPDQAVESGTAIRIMTGAPLPPGANAVVKVEDTETQGDDALIFVEVEPGNYVRPAGEDVQHGERVLRRGARLRPQEIGMLAAVGREDVPVARKPRVAILATGDELVAVHKPLAPGKIRNTNSYSNAAQVLQHGGEPILLGIARDTVKELTAAIAAGLRQNVDLFLTSGGVSVGDFDLVKDVLASEGEMDFWRVRMKPGKPLAFGHIQGVPILGLPGNPVSVMVSFEMFVRPALLTLQGARDWRRPEVEAVLMNEIAHKDDRRHFARVRLVWEDGQYRAHLTGAQGSGILSSMVKANALAIIPEEWERADAGSRVQVMVLDHDQTSFAR